MIGQSVPMRRIMSLIERIASSDVACSDHWRKRDGKRDHGSTHSPAVVAQGRSVHARQLCRDS